MAPHLGIEHFEDRVYLWAKDRGLDPERYLPIAREDTDIWPVFTMPEWLRYRDVLEPLVEQVIAPLKTPYGVITRLALVRLPAGGHIPPHIDGQAMAIKAHRIHVPLTSSPAVEYKIGGRKFTMRAGRAYDFNNRVPPLGAQQGQAAAGQPVRRLLPEPRNRRDQPALSLDAGAHPTYAPPELIGMSVRRGRTSARLQIAVVTSTEIGR